MDPNPFKDIPQLTHENDNFRCEADDGDALTMTTLSTRTSAVSSAYLIQQVHDQSSKRVKCRSSSNQEGTYDFQKSSKGFKRKRHIKKPLTRYVKDEEEIQDSKRFICFSKPFIPYILLNVVVSAGVSAISCACFFAFISSSLKVKENAPSSNAISHCYGVSTVTTDHSMNIEEFDESSNLSSTKGEFIETISSEHPKSFDNKMLEFAKTALPGPVIFEVTQDSVRSIESGQRRKHEKVLANVVRTLSYTSVVLNEGSAINCTDGKFTAPVTGIYFFHFSGIALSSTYLQVFVMPSATFSMNHNKSNRIRKKRRRFPNIRLAVELPAFTGCESSISPLFGHNASANKSYRSCTNNKGSPVSQTFTQKLSKEDQLWLAVVLEHFYVASATPMRFIGFLQTPLL